MSFHPQGHHHVKVTLNHPKHPNPPLVNFATIPPPQGAPKGNTPPVRLTSVSSPSHASSHHNRMLILYPTFAVSLPVSVRCRPTPPFELEVHPHPRSLKRNSNHNRLKKVQSLSLGPAMSTLHCSTSSWSLLTLHCPLLVNIHSCKYK